MKCAFFSMKLHLHFIDKALLGAILQMNEKIGSNKENFLVR